MSTLNVANITDNTTSVPTGYVVNGSAKAWCNVNGTGTIAIRDSQNVSSVTDNGTGDVEYSFSNAMSNTNYVQTCCAGFVNDDGMSRYYELTSRWRTYYFLLSTRNAKDGNVNSSAIFGDLA